MMLSSSFSFILYILLIVHWAIAQPEGWRMIDRFYGFRYEIKLKNENNLSLMQSIQEKAGELRCFGWIQEVGDGSKLVGEGRCAKNKGQIFNDWLKGLPNILKYDNLVRYKK
jgi:hypothetical protein